MKRTNLVVVTLSFAVLSLLLMGQTTEPQTAPPAPPTKESAVEPQAPPAPASADAAPAEPADPKLEELLQDAYAGEIVAQKRYVAFATKADEEGYHGVASLFRAAGKAEGVHAQRMAELLKTRGQKPIDPAFEADVKSTRENLLVAMDNERDERDNLYRERLDRAKQLGAKQTTQMFDLARTAESEHANLCTIANAMMADQKDAKTYHVCEHCGFTTDVKLAKCPSCREGALVAVK